jgi:HK97 gp10 family phage protein
MAGINGRVIAQLNSLQNLGDIMPLPAAQYVAKQARSYAHVITGFMRDHTVARKEGKGAVVVSSAPYAAFEEYGTRYRPAHPFIRPAIADGAIYLPGMLAREVNAEIRRRVTRA